jgi:hypothetical protein
MTGSYTVALAAGGGDAGKTYKFRASALNVHGWGPVSSVATILAADVPGVIASATIALTGGTSVRLAWQVPAANGSPIDSYKVELLGTTGTYVTEAVHCSGTAPAVLSAASCTLPMSALTSAPWNLALGAAITYRVTARNAIGWQTAASGA